MTPQELDAKAKACYDACQSVKPRWEQIGNVTRSVWREYVLAGQTPADWRAPRKRVRVDDETPIYRRRTQT